MYKNILKGIGLFTLIGFSFFYSEKVITVIKEKDPIMIKLEEIKETKKISSLNAVIENNTIIPGICERVIDINKSYNNMKKIGMYSENYLEYEISCNKDILENNYDKYVINGNKLTNNVSVVFLLKNDNLLESVASIGKKYNITLNFFINYKYMNENISKVYKISKNNEIYNYGEDGNYTLEGLEIGNNIIERVTKRKAKYCYSSKDNPNTLELCSKKKMNTIRKEEIKEGLYVSVKNNLANGNIILISLNDSNVNELDNTINFILKKGFNVVGLSKLLSE